MRVRRCDAGRGLQGGRPLYAGAHAQAGAPGAPVRDKTESASFGCVYPDAGCKADLQFCPPFAGRGPCVRSGGICRQTSAAVSGYRAFGDCRGAFQQGGNLLLGTVGGRADPSGIFLRFNRSAGPFLSGGVRRERLCFGGLSTLLRLFGERAEKRHLKRGF